MNNFLCTRFRLFSSSLSDDSIIIMVAPDLCCWYCENPLRPGFCGVHAHQPTASVQRRLLFLTCTGLCQQGVLNECQQSGISGQPWSGPEVRKLLDDEDRIWGIGEAISLIGLCRRAQSGAR